jgi:hypothetical protein
MYTSAVDLKEGMSEEYRQNCNSAGFFSLNQPVSANACKSAGISGGCHRFYDSWGRKDADLQAFCAKSRFERLMPAVLQAFLNYPNASSADHKPANHKPANHMPPEGAFLLTNPMLVVEHV